MRFSLTAAFIGAAALISSVSADLYNRLDLSDSVFLFVDHQTGLFNLVQDYNPDTYLNNVMGLAETAKYFNATTILTTSREDGPNGPMLPAIKTLFPNAPYIARPGQINAWDDEDFVKAIKKTGKKQLIVSGIVTDVCVTFVALSARKAGYEVFVVTDASGTFSEAVRDASWLRMQQAGVQLMNWFGVACELGRDWRRDIEGMAALFAKRLPSYAHVMDSYNGAQAALKAQ
ncbi:isochorismatase family protein [Gilbertella persicaria]|uniref:isochorismatase family protein n=1 Tax=Gilbertella persicaria TaxID=101096 RepID=UPI00221FB83B|nr:isochorismatase family protein [Gilbertella persicaria]KAI8087715.1 isochorismatase family protein [Gilbertella persicaria]